MALFLDMLVGYGLLLGVAWVLVIGLRRWYRNSDDPQSLLFKWGITLLDLLFIIFVVAPLLRQGGFAGAFGGVPMAAVAGLIMAIVWTPNLTAAVGRKVGSLYDGGEASGEPEPILSVAEARRRQGKPREAIEELRRQIEAFPSSVTPRIMLAEIQAEDMGDLEAAAVTIEQLVNLPGQSRSNAAIALTRLADWRLKHAKDIPSARQCFERIVELYPDSPEAYAAHQRLARLAVAEASGVGVEAAPIALPKADPTLGLRSEGGWRPKPPDHLARATELVAQLERFPMDSLAREDLALTYANELDRPDLAAEQFMQLISQPHAPEKQVVHWLNQLADLQVRSEVTLEAARQTVQKIIELYPHSAAAENAKRRLSVMNLEGRAKKESQVVRLGSYEQKLGLKKP
jgi:tetratricopeptide (TPR) repeat protein